MKTLLFLSFCLSALSLCMAQLPAQSSGSVATGSNINIFDTNRFSMASLRTDTNVLPYNDIEGTPYIDNNTGAGNNLPIGKFYSPDFVYLETALARYNAYTDQMEVSLLQDGVDYYILKKAPDFFYVVLKDKTYRAYRYDEGVGYFVIRSNDDTHACTLLMKERIAFRKAKKAESSFVTGTPNSFQKLRDVYYFKLADTVVAIPKKKKDFLTLFTTHRAAIKAYMEEHRLRPTNEEDLLQLARYYNSL